MKTLRDFIIEQSVNGGMYIFRDQMPQISDYDSFVKVLDQHGIESSYEDVDITTPKPTQLNIDDEKVRNMPLTDKPIIISGTDNYILDGHHRFYSTVLHKKDKIKALVAYAPISNLLSIAKSL